MMVSDGGKVWLFKRRMAQANLLYKLLEAYLNSILTPDNLNSHLKFRQ